MQNPSETRPRSKSTFSFRSDKSDKNGRPKQKMDLTETEAEKKKTRFSTKSKVDPTRALNEPQPMFQALEHSTLPQRRATPSRDIYGNTIMDPDKANPTRHRLERPLDTIRSFEAAIDSSFKRRSQAVRAESAEAIPSFSRSRPGSHYGSMNDIPIHNPRYSSSASAYGSRNASLRGNYDYAAYGQFSQRRAMPPRMQTSPLPVLRPIIDHSVYNSHMYQDSHDTVNTAGESSGSQSEPWGYSTDPSSENSSIDRIHAIKPTDSGDAYAGGQYGPGQYPGGQHSRGSPMHSPIQEEYWQDGRFQPDAYQQQHIPQMPQQAPVRSFAAPPSSYSQQQPATQRRVIQLGGVNEATGMNGASNPSAGRSQYTAPSPAQMQKGADKGENKKSWLKRRFSKNA